MIDKRITPRYVKYERVDLWLGIAVVVLGAAAILGFTAATLHAGPEAGHFTDAAGVVQGLGSHVGRLAGILFALAAVIVIIPGSPLVLLTAAVLFPDISGTAILQILGGGAPLALLAAAGIAVVRLRAATSGKTAPAAPRGTAPSGAPGGCRR